MVQDEPTEAAIRDENERLKRLRGIVSIATIMLRQSNMPIEDAVRLVEGVRAQALALFPGREETWDIIYAPRFARLLRESYGVEYPES